MITKSIVVAIAGAPNAGKSTLINRIVGQKISIVTSKCQTTRFNTKGIVNLENTQIVLIDTPGLFQPNRALEKMIVKQAKSGLQEADIICLIVDVLTIARQDFVSIIKQFQYLQKKIVLVFNKVDALPDKSILLVYADTMRQLYNFDEIFMISAKKSKGVSDLIKYLERNASEGPWLFEEDIASDITDRKLADEITRESLYYALGSELPYSLEVQTELWEEKEDGSIKINQVIHLLKNSQKKIVLGAGGQKLKSISVRSREQLTRILNKSIHLFLYVKVKPDWIERLDQKGHFEIF